MHTCLQTHVTLRHAHFRCMCVPPLSDSSIPQKNTTSQLAAIDTIANYAALSKYFVVTAPETVHQDTGLTRDAKTYLGRG